MIAFFTCGGCSGRRVYRLVNALKKYGLEVVHLSSCMLIENTYPKCPILIASKKQSRMLELRSWKVLTIETRKNLRF
jgi:predicted metal-binding protein